MISVKFVNILKKYPCLFFYVISCIFDNNLASSVPTCPSCISFLSLSSGSACLSWAVNQSRVEEPGFPMISAEVEEMSNVLGSGILFSLLNLTYPSIPSSSELPPPHYIQWVIPNFQTLLLVSCFSILAFSCHGALVCESDH